MIKPKPPCLLCASYRYNNLFYELAQISLGTTGTGAGTFAGGGRGAYIYPGARVSYVSLGMVARAVWGGRHHLGLHFLFQVRTV